MSVRAEVREFVRLGPLVNEGPAVDDASVGALLERQQEALEKIEPPVTVEEAKLLVNAFGPDSDTCFGLAWMLLHLIETAPDPVPESEPPPNASWWAHQLWGRIETAKRMGLTGPKPQAPPWPADPAWEPAPGQSVWLLDDNAEKLLRGTIKARDMELKPGTWWVVHVGARIFRRVTSELRLDRGGRRRYERSCNPRARRSDHETPQALFRADRRSPHHAVGVDCPLAQRMR